MKKLFLLLLALPAFCQPPDCTLPINIPVGSTLPFNVGPFDNRTAGCTTWQIIYNSYTYSALSIVVQTADNTSPGVPGSYSTFAAVSGINPNTNTAKNVTTFGGPTSYFPWIRVQLTSATGAGTISGRLYGWRIPPEASVIITPSGTQDVNITEIDGTAAVAARAGVLGVGIVGNAAVLSGQQSVTGSAVALASNASKSACVKALVGNSINVFVGPTGITTSTGYLLAPGESVCLPVTNTNLLFVIASTTGASVSWAASN